MKKISYLFAIAAVALVSAFAFSSCGNDDDVKGESQKEPKLEYRIFVSDEVLALGEVEVGVSFAGQTDVKKVKANGSATKEDKDGSMFNGKVLLIQDIKDGSKVAVSFVPDEKAVAALPAEGSTAWAIKVVAKDVARPLTLKNHSVGSGEKPVPNGELIQTIIKGIKDLGYEFK